MGMSHSHHLGLLSGIVGVAKVTISKAAWLMMGLKGWIDGIRVADVRKDHEADLIDYLLILAANAKFELWWLPRPKFDHPGFLLLCLLLRDSQEDALRSKEVRLSVAEGRVNRH